jgi:hypothetical protein
MMERFVRNDNYLTHIAIISDPVYLAEPMIRSSDFVVNTAEVANWRWPCVYVEEISGRPKGEVPHHLPGENPFLTEFQTRTGAPPAAVRGGPSTIYPEYQSRLAEGRPVVDSAEAPRASQAPNPDTGALEVLPVQGRVHLLAGGGANVVLSVGDSGALVVDSKSPAMVEPMLKAIESLSTSGKPVRYVLNTSGDAEHVGGNESFAKALGSLRNWTIINTPGASQTAVQILAHDNVLPRVASLPSTAWPTETS